MGEVTPEKECTFEPPFKACAILTFFQGVSFFWATWFSHPTLYSRCIFFPALRPPTIPINYIMLFQSMQLSRLSLLFFICPRKWFTPCWSLPALFYPSSSSSFANSHFLSIPVAGLSSCGECSYGGFRLHIHPNSRAGPASWFCPSA